MKNLKLKKTIFFITSSFILYSTCAHFTKYKPNYEILITDDESDAFGKYGGGLIYIGDYAYLRELKNTISDGDILVLDRRNRQDPDMQVQDSYLITNQDDIKDIINCLIEYESIYPTNWNRSLDSMTVEWEVHNLFYKLNYQRNRTDDVDLNNADEKLYNNIILKKLFLRW